MRLGVLGGGQLGQMIALAGIPLDVRFVFYGPDAPMPAGAVGDVIQGGWHDEAALGRFADQVDAVTLEFENVALDTAAWLAERRPFWPPPAVLAIAQDRVHEKTCFNELGIETPRFAAVDTPDEAREAARRLGAPGILKTRRFGYDGKGQVRVADPDEAAAACATLGGVPLIYEVVVPFDRELSVIAARGADGTVVVYPLTENHHRRGILRESIAPAPTVVRATADAAVSYITRVLDHFGYVGVLALELFDVGGRLLANEMAPRVHNSGHWTIEGAAPSQFESHVRAVCGLPLIEPALLGHARMLNVIGGTPPEAELLAIPGARVHLYGKSAAPGRKLGHVTVVAADAARADAIAARVKQVLQHAADG